MGYLGHLLRMDYNTNCNSEEYNSYLIFAVISAILYPIGIPLFFYFLIRNRNEPWAMFPANTLCLNFAEYWAYFEVVELFRKFLLTSVLEFVAPGKASQALFITAINFIALLILAVCRPYSRNTDDFLSGVIIFIECIIFSIALLIISGVSANDNYNEDTLMHICFALVLLVLCFFVPINAFSKIPVTREKIEALQNMFSSMFRRVGLNINDISELDCRTRLTRQVRTSDIDEYTGIQKFSTSFRKSSKVRGSSINQKTRDALINSSAESFGKRSSALASERSTSSSSELELNNL